MMTRYTHHRRDFLAAAFASALVAPAAFGQNAKARPARIAFIGVGSRGTGLLRSILAIPGVTVPAICDINEAHLDRAIAAVEKAHGNTPAGYSKDEYDYRRMLARDDFDAVLIATPVDWHAVMSLDAMNAGKDVGSEVPACRTLEECRDLVRTKEKTGTRYMLLENYVYTRARMQIYNMARAGVFGDLYYAECGYIHDCLALLFDSKGALTWRGEVRARLFGNTYPTHSIGPISKMMSIHRGDRMAKLVAMMSAPRSSHHYAVEQFGPGSEAAKVKFTYGDYCSCLIQTANGAMIRCDFDSHSRRPAKMFYLVQGTKGLYDSDHGVYLHGKSPAQKYESTSEYSKDYDHNYWASMGEEAKSAGHGGGDFFVLSDFVTMVRDNREPFVDVYDAAAWSAVSPLSMDSIRGGCGSVEFPDFTNGRWKEKEWPDAPWL